MTLRTADWLSRSPDVLVISVPAARWRMAVRVATLTMTGLGIAWAIAFWHLLTVQNAGGQPVDFVNYWRANPASLYPHTDAAGALAQGYLYTPAFEFFAAPWRLLPFAVALGIYRALLLVILVRLAGPLTLFALLLFPVASEINCGNVQLLLALALYLSSRWPAAWAFVLLSKVAPGVGLLYLLLRREWRELKIALGATAIVGAAALILFSSQWPAYFQLMSNPAPATGPLYITLWQRLPFAVAIVAIGAWRGWRWTIVVAAFLALPNWYYISPSILVALLPVLRARAGAAVDSAIEGLATDRPQGRMAPERARGRALPSAKLAG